MKIQLRLPSFCIFAISMTLTACQYQDKKNKDMDTPNVLFIAIDDMNDWVGVLGGHPQTKTPNIDKLATRGILFTNAHTPAPACSPCRNAILYGIEPHNSGLYPFYNRDKMDPVFFNEHKSMFELFRENGYNTYAAGKIHHDNSRKESIAMFDSLEFTESINDKLLLLPKPIVDTTDGVGPKTYGNSCERPLISPLEEEFDYNVAKFGIDVVHRKHDKPFFLAVGFKAPHTPLVAPKKYFDMFPRETIVKPEIKDDDLADLSWVARSNAKIKFDHQLRTQDAWEDRIRAYLACIAYTDENVGRVIEGLNNSEYRDNTVIVLWSDHGYHFGEKRSDRKFSLWEEATRVPLIIVDPRYKESTGKSCAAPVSLIDLYPTLLKRCGIQPKEGSNGYDLAELLLNPSEGKETPALTTWGRGNYSLRTSKWRYTRYFDGSEELYDHEKDPNEWDNLAENIEYEKVKEKLKIYLPKHEAPLVQEGSHLHYLKVDADSPSLNGFIKLWNSLKEDGMNLE